jgi:hypothetical protein
VAGGGWSLQKELRAAGLPEDILGENVLLPLVSALVGKKIALTKDDQAKGSLVDQIASAVARAGETLPEGWKPEIVRRLGVEWSVAKPRSIPAGVLDRAKVLFKALTEQFQEGIEP